MQANGQDNVFSALEVKHGQMDCKGLRGGLKPWCLDFIADNASRMPSGSKKDLLGIFLPKKDLLGTFLQVRFCLVLTQNPTPAHLVSAPPCLPCAVKAHFCVSAPM